MTTSSAQVPTVVDQRTGQAVPVYLGGEAPAESSTTAAPADREDSLSTPALAAAAVADSAPPTDPVSESQTNTNDADPPLILPLHNPMRPKPPCQHQMRHLPWANSST